MGRVGSRSLVQVGKSWMRQQRVSFDQHKGPLGSQRYWMFLENPTVDFLHCEIVSNSGGMFRGTVDKLHIGRVNQMQVSFKLDKHIG